jgi:hypothetical protein
MHHRHLEPGRRGLAERRLEVDEDDVLLKLRRQTEDDVEEVADD